MTQTGTSKMYENHRVDEEMVDDLTNAESEASTDEPNKCDQCTENFQTFNEMMKHIKAIHKPVCILCNVTYKDFKNLRSHKRLYHQKECEEALFCEECGKRCKNKNLLNQHWSFVHKRVENLNCNLCGKSCPNMAKLRKHTKKCLTKEDFESLYQSNLAGHIIDPNSLRTNLQNKEQNEEEILDFDNKIEYSDEDRNLLTPLKDHEEEEEVQQKHKTQLNEEKETLLDYGALAFLSREPVKSETTQISKEESKDADEAKSETIEVKQEEDDSDEEGSSYLSDNLEEYFSNTIRNERKMYTCVLCSAQVKDLKQHTKRQHLKMPEKESICEECGKIFSKACNLKAHIKSNHSGEPMECPECGVKVMNLKQHTRRQHKRNSDGELEPESICNHCGKIFDKSSKLKGHIATVHTQNESICHICSKEFKNPHYLRCHIRVVHTSNDQVTCHLCMKTYTSKQKLYHHQRAVHTLEDARCQPCGKTYKNKDLLKKHQRLYHPGFNNNSADLKAKSEWSSPTPNKTEWNSQQSNKAEWSSPPPTKNEWSTPPLKTVEWSSPLPNTTKGNSPFIDNIDWSSRLPPPTHSHLLQFHSHNSKFY